MPGKKRKRRTLSSLAWENIREEWGIWLVIAILLLCTFSFSNQLAAWLKKLTFIKVLDSLGKLGLLIAIIAFLREIPKWEERTQEEAQRRQFEYWKVIDAAKVAREASPDKDKRFTSHALRMALENLAKERDSEGNPIRMRNIDLSGVNLEDGINLSGVDLSLSKFRYANLSGVDLSRTTLHRATFARARIFGTNFHFADLGSDQYKATFKQALYDESTIFPDNFDPDNVGAFKIAPGVSLIKASLVKALLWDANLERSDLDSADLERATLDGSNFQECNLQRANLRGVTARNANFQGANLCDADFQGTNLFDAIFSHANIQGVNFQKAEYMNVEQIKAAQHWEKAIYDDDFRKELGLLP